MLTSGYGYCSGNHGIWTTKYITHFIVMRDIYCLWLSTLYYINTPCPPVVLDKTRKHLGILLWYHPVRWLMQFYDVHIYYCMVYIEVTTSSISDKATTTSITSGVGVILRSDWTHLCSQSGSITGKSVLWSE